MHKNHLLFLLTVLFLPGMNAILADTVKLKSGTQYDGKITLQTPDMVKIEVTITDKIKETKTVAMADVAEIVKSAPDDVLFSKVQVMVPTGSLITADQYRSMITTGPEAFLSLHPSSRHKEKVEAIKKTLEEELDKVERGNIKLDNEWFTPQDRNDFPEHIESKIGLFRMRSNQSGGRYLNNISAMRDFETLENNYFGTPAFAEAVSLAQQVLPNLGRQLQGMRRDVDVKNAEWEASKNALDVVARQSVENARAREEADYSAQVEADKKAKIKWTRVNPRSAPNLDSYIQFTLGEYNRIQRYEAAAIKARADALLEVDKLIKLGKLAEAKIQLASATSMPTEVRAAPTAPGKARPSSSPKGGRTNYASALLAKVNAKEAEQKAIAKAAADSQKSNKLAADLKENESPAVSTDLTATTPTTDGQPLPTEEPKAAAVDDFDLLATAKKPEKPVKEESKDEKKPKKTVSKTKSTASSRPPVEEKSFPFYIIPIALGVLAGGAVIAMKVLGIGGAKKESE